MKRISDEDELVLAVPEVVEVTPVRVQPPIVVVVIYLEDVRVAVGVSNVHMPICATTF